MLPKVDGEEEPPELTPVPCAWNEKKKIGYVTNQSVF